MGQSNYDIDKCQVHFCKSMLNQHNIYRNIHQAKNLTIDDSISKISQKYAEKLAKANNELVHSNSNYGENLAYQMDSRFKLDQKTCEG